MNTKIFELIVDVGNDAFKIYMDAENEKEAEEKCVKDGKVVCYPSNIRKPIGRKGEIVRIKDVTAIYQPAADELSSSFQADGMGKIPLDGIIGMLKLG